MYNSYNVAELIKNTAKTKGISVNQLLKLAGLGKNTMSNFRTSMPKADNLAKIADCLDVSVDYLLGRSNTSPEINSRNTINGNNNVIGNGNLSVEHLSEQENALLHIFGELNVVDQAKLLAYASELQENK